MGSGLALTGLCRTNLLYRLEGDATHGKCKNPPLSNGVAPYFRWRPAIDHVNCTNGQS